MDDVPRSTPWQPLPWLRGQQRTTPEESYSPAGSHYSSALWVVGEEQLGLQLLSV